MLFVFQNSSLFLSNFLQKGPFLQGGIVKGFLSFSFRGPNTSPKKKRMGSSLSVLDPHTPVVAPIDMRFATEDDNEVRVYSINSTPTSTEISNPSNPQESFFVKTPVFSRTPWEATDCEGRELCQIKRKYLSFKSCIFVEIDGKRREFTIDKPGSVMDTYEVYCGDELVYRIRDHLSSYNLEFYEPEKKSTRAQSPERSSSPAPSDEVEVELGEEPAHSEEEEEFRVVDLEEHLGNMVAQVSSSFCRGVFLRASPNVDALLCSLVFLCIRSARNGQ